MEYQVRIYPDGKAYFPNIDFGSNPITVWHEDKEYIVFKLPAGRHWESILDNSVSHPGKYMITRIEEEVYPKVHEVAGVRYFRVHELFTMPLSNRGREK